MKVTVKAFAEFRELLGGEMVVPILRADSVRGLLQRLGSTHPVFVSRILQDDGGLRPAVIILLNGRNIQSLDGVDSKIGDGDVLAVFSPIAGG